MEQLIINKKSGGTIELLSYENNSTITSAEQIVELIGQDIVKVSIIRSSSIDLAIGDYIEVVGRKYQLNQLPTAKKISEQRYEYELIFEGPQYDLLRVQYIGQDSSMAFTAPDFPLIGTLQNFMSLLVSNLNRVFPGVYSLGTCPNDETKTLNFNEENCLAVLQKLCKEFGQEFEIIGTSTKVINIKKIGQVLGFTYQYGQGKGLFDLRRENVSDKNIITRLYAFGSDKNLKSNYRGYSQRLLLPSPATYIEHASAKAAFGVIESTKVFDDIYPHYKGTVSSIGGTELVFSDSSVPFDLNELDGLGNTKYLVSGTTAKINFLTGGLAGYTFEVNAKNGYSHATKTFTLIKYKDQRGEEFPSATFSTFQIQPGDKYVIIDIMLPDAYVTTAENLLLSKATEYLNQNCAPRVQYSITLDELFLKTYYNEFEGINANYYWVGDYVSIKDDDLLIDKSSRVISFVRDLMNPFRYTLNIADSYEVSLIERMIADNTEVNAIVRLRNLKDARSAKQGWRATQELLNMVFDSDDYFKDGNIRPLSIQTSMLQVGAKSQQFILNVVLEPNYLGNKNSFKINAGFLTHYTVEETIKTWNIGAGIYSLVDDGARYIYAKCNKSNLSDAGILLSTLQIKPNDDANYYHFLVGVLHAVDTSTNVRFISLTYGSTTINGRFIRTGRIQSADGQTWFDLDSNEIKGKISFISQGTTKDLETFDSDISSKIDSKSTRFTSTPIPPYKIGDLWANGEELRKCIAQKNAGESYNIIDWDLATNYDRTKTVIDGGIVTSGTVQLAGDPGNIKAGITGEGNYDSSVRVWAGASFENRGYAPFRVLQSGEVFARKRIEMMNSSNIGQAGICGANTSGESSVRIWAGTDYDNRDNAAFKVLDDGRMYSYAGRIAGFNILGDGLTNSGYNNEAYIVLEHTDLNVTARMGVNVLSSTSGAQALGLFQNLRSWSGTNYGAIFKASGGSLNYAIHADTGKSMLKEALLNGRSYYYESFSALTRSINPSQYDIVVISPSGSSAAITWDNNDNLANGKEVLIFNANNGQILTLNNIIRGYTTFNIEGGGAMTIFFFDGYWYIKSFWNNDF
ncbi:phage tail protein [Aquirufa nivalisilvae]|uniref:phage tail protein n=1 Tax=Aquirufa nivalisilvae TaxID=2516557 RepID=UPI0022A9E0A4|nr:phage tail protein [Aquirufa nivalisilvae]MCZ2480002.1 hypothetical protein [Aquirufa nivalisilvae]